MSLSVQIGTEYIDLSQDATLDMEQQNPFLQFNDEILGSYSLPFEILATSKNLRLTNYAGVVEKRVDNTGIDAIVSDNGMPHSRGKVKIEKSMINLNKTREGRISCYYLTGASGFWQDIRNKKLRDIDVGGDRSFIWDDYNHDGAGFWAHVLNVANGLAGHGISGYDYAFFPVINNDWYPSIPAHDFPLVMNQFIYEDGKAGLIELPTPVIAQLTILVPFPYLVYVLKKAVEFTGWRIVGDILDDEDFKKITMLNFHAIDWATPVWIYTWVKKRAGNVTFNLKDNLPDIDISTFLIALKNRFGWWYDFDKASKIITIRHLKAQADNPAKDFTVFSSPLVTKTINQETKIYALTNDFATNLADGAPNYAQVKRGGDVNTVADLPVPTDAMYGQIWLVISENNFYICQISEDDPYPLEWAFYTYNIYNVEPEGFTDEVKTKATTVGMEAVARTYYYFDFIPRIDNLGEWFGSPYEEETSWGIHLCFFHGLQPNKEGELYPYGSSHVYNSVGDQVGNWSLAFECKLLDGTDVGLYQREWKAFLDLLKSNEVIELILNLPFADYLNLSFLDQIVVRNTRMFIQTMKNTIPYNGSIKLECTRI